MNPCLPTFVHRLNESGYVSLDVLGEGHAGFENRFKIQKYVYLARYYGLDMGYVFGMYIHGPYSSELANDYYELAKIGSMAEEYLPDSFDENSYFTLIRDKDTEWLEAAATLLSLNTRFNDKQVLLERVMNMKSHINPEKVVMTLEELNKRELVNLH